MKYTLLNRAVLPPESGGAPYGFTDLRAEVEAISDMARVRTESVQAERIGSDGQPLFGNLNMIVVHHSGGKPTDPMALVRWAINDCVDPDHATSPYHFLIDTSGKIFWLAAIKWLTYHAYGANANGIGIVLEGDWSNTLPPKEMLDAGRWLIAALYEFFGQDWGKQRLTGIIPHRFVWNGKTWHTACPGLVWPSIIWSGPFPKLEPPQEGL